MNKKPEKFNISIFYQNIRSLTADELLLSILETELSINNCIDVICLSEHYLRDTEIG